MMEGKAWTLVCVLLLTGRGSAEPGDGHAASSNSSSSSAAAVTPGASSAGPVVPTSLAPDAAADAALNRSDPSPSPAVAVAAGNSSVTVTTTLSTSPSPFTHPEDTQTPLLTPNQSSTPQSPGDVWLTSTVLPNTSVLQPGQGTLPVTHPLTTSPSTSAPANTTTAPNTIQSATSSTGSPQDSASSPSAAITSPKHTQQPDGQPETTGVTQQATTAAAPSSMSTQAKPHTNSPSQLNVGGNTTMLHQTPKLDPLLAALVSAFIITAVIITLLLFLKLRRRNSRPEFRRLQDLPMDDMEDTPLSMYSY